MSDTPQTDKEIYHSSRYDGEEIPGFDYVDADFARSLERQRNELLNALEQLLNQFDSEIHNEYDGTGMLEDRLSEANYARRIIKKSKEPLQ